MVPGGRRCTIHEMGCPDDCCEYSTLNKKAVLKTTIFRKKRRVPLAFRSRVWRRKDYKKSLGKILMTNSDIENCLFEPAAGSMN